MTQSLHFTKMQGAGNDFIIHDLRHSAFSLDQIVEHTPTLCDRRYGVGADGLIILDDTEHAAYRMIYKNADGSDAGMCGNGGRCIARYAVSKGVPAEHAFSVHEQIYHAQVNAETVTLDFPSETRVESLLDEVGGYKTHPGTEHIVVPVEEHRLQEEDYLRNKGQTLRNHDLFQPVGTNVNFIHGVTADTLMIQTYERGVEDLTLACGTGAIASALVWHHMESAAGGVHEYKVRTEGGELFVSSTFDPNTGIYSNLKLGGPAHFVFEGTIEL